MRAAQTWAAVYERLHAHVPRELAGRREAAFSAGTVYAAIRGAAKPTLIAGDGCTTDRAGRNRHWSNPQLWQYLTPVCCANAEILLEGVDGDAFVLKIVSRRPLPGGGSDAGPSSAR